MNSASMIKRPRANFQSPKRLKLRTALMALGIAVEGEITRDHIGTAHRIFRKARGESRQINDCWNVIKRHICRVCDGVKISTNTEVCSIVCRVTERTREGFAPVAKQILAVALFLCASVGSGQTLTALPQLPQALTAPAPLPKFNVRLLWKPATNGASAYRLYWGTNVTGKGPTFYASLKFDTKTTNATVSVERAGLEYYFQLAYVSSNNVETLAPDWLTNYVLPILDITTFSHVVRVDAPNLTNRWQVSTDLVNWTTVATVVTNRGARLQLIRTNAGGEFVRLK